MNPDYLPISNSRGVIPRHLLLLALTARATAPVRRGTRNRAQAHDSKLNQWFLAATNKEINAAIGEKSNIAAVIVCAVTNKLKMFCQAMSALDSAKWWAAMSDKINGLFGQGIWELADLPKGHKTIKCKWVYKLKTNKNGNIN